MNYFLIDAECGDKVAFSPDTPITLGGLLQETELLFQCFTDIGFEYLNYFTQPHTWVESTYKDVCAQELCRLLRIPSLDNISIPIIVLSLFSF